MRKSKMKHFPKTTTLSALLVSLIILSGVIHPYDYKTFVVLLVIVWGLIASVAVFYWLYKRSTR